MHTGRILMLAGGLVLLIGARLPWMSSLVLFGVDFPASQAIEIGWEDNGFITGMIGLILLLVGSFGKGKTGKFYSAPGAFLAILAVLVVTGCFKRILEINPSAGFLAATKIGIHVTLGGALLALGGALRQVPIQGITRGALKTNK